MQKHEESTSLWDENSANWSTQIDNGSDQINEAFGIPHFLSLTGDIQGKTVLDAGCGEGRSTRHLAMRGGQLTGIDISEAMIENAIKKNAAQLYQADFAIASCSDLSIFSENQFDVITSFMALMDTPDLSVVLQQFYRVLKPGGKLSIMVRHPCFFTSGMSIFKSPSQQRSGLLVADYFRATPFVERWSFSGSADVHFKVRRYPYTLSDYLQTLLRNQFKIIQVAEPRPSEELVASIPNLQFWRRHASLYLYIAANK